LFLCREKDIWGSLTDETWLCEGLAEQLVVPHQEVDELAPIGREWLTSVPRRRMLVRMPTG
jgi:hypothetical protein